MTRGEWLGPNGERARRLELHLTYGCPQRCPFCSEAHRMEEFRAYPVTIGRVARVLRKHVERGVTSLHLTGGEPTIHKRFLDVLRLARKLGLKTSVGTNGSMLARPEFAEQALPLLDEVLFSVHGPEAAVHDQMVGRDGSFDTVVRAFGTLRELTEEVDVYTNTVVTRRNLAALPATVGLVDTLGAELAVISNLSPEGHGLDRYAELTVRLERLAEVLPTLPALASRARLRFFGVPLCALGEHWSKSNDLHWDPRVTVEWVSEPGRVWLADVYTWDPGRKRVHPEVCDRCSRRSVCAGIFDRYVELFPTDSLTPFP